MSPTFASFLSGIGMGELIVVMIIVLIIFGAGKLPQIGDALGKGIRNFKTSVTGTDDEPKTDAKSAEAKPAESKPAESKPAEPAEKTDA